MSSPQRYVIAMSLALGGFVNRVLPLGPSPTIAPDFQSSHLAIGLSRNGPRFTYFSVDSLGGGKTGQNPVLQEESASSRWHLEKVEDGKFTYRSSDPASRGPDAWTITCQDRTLTLRSSWTPNGPAVPPFELLIDQKANHATLLGLMKPGERSVALPAVLHFPDLGSLRIRSSRSTAKLDYDARRFFEYDKPQSGRPYVNVAFPGANEATPEIEYSLEVAAIHPALADIDRDPLFDGFRRNFLNIFQLNPRIQMLANNASSDPCTFTLFSYAEVARCAPPLVDSLTPLDLVRMTLDRYFAGAKGYGQAGFGPTPEAPDLGRWKPPCNSLDALPSLLLSACYCAENRQGLNWARQHYDALAAWGREIFAGDKDGNGLIEYPQSGNYVAVENRYDRHRPANWWDAIMFGHEDAYSNALAYRAATCFAELAEKLGQPDDAAFFTKRAAKLRAAYVPTFLNPKTGVLAGWKSSDGELHDYGFLFVNGAAITYGLVDEPQANAIMDRLLRQLSDVGYTCFQYGLPGNLVPIRRGDYYKHGNENAHRWGEPLQEDGSDGFQIYENGGATGCFAYFTYQALYQLGRVEDARRLFLPALRGYAAGGFQGFDRSGQSFDWRDWKGTGHGYEGFLVDNYLALLAGIDEWKARK